jgi:uncharacterized protein YdhG (YjbR/CyaY superfamily)
MSGTVDEYINAFEGEKREWLITMVTFMRDNFPELEETIFYQMPAFRLDRGYIAFSVAKDHFTYHTLDFRTIDELKSSLPSATFGRGSVKIRFSDREAIPVLFEASRRTVERWRSGKAGR